MVGRVGNSNKRRVPMDIEAVRISFDATERVMATNRSLLSMAPD